MQHKILEELLASLFLKSFQRTGGIDADLSSCQADFRGEVDLCGSVVREWDEFLASREAYLKLSSRVMFVSLGEDCFPRTVLSHLGFKQIRSQGEPSLPFDLMALPASSVAHLLAHDFVGLTESKSLTYNGRHPVNHLLNIDFNHEQGEAFADSEFAELRARYQRRTKSFLDVARTGLDDRGRKVVYCIHHYHADQPVSSHMIDILEETLAKKGMDNDCAILYIDNTATRPDSVYRMSNSRVVVVSLRYPYEGYVWHENVHRFSSQGLRFSNQLGLLVLDALVQCNYTSVQPVW